LDVTDDASENGDIEGFDKSEKKLSISSKSKEYPPSPHRESYITVTARLKKKLALIYKLWLSFSVVSIGLLLIVFICSMEYCIQNGFDLGRYNALTDEGKNEYVIEDGKKRVIPPCYAESKETTDLRTALSDLYSYCLINIFVIVCFMFVVYYQLKRVTRRRPIKEDKVNVLSPDEDEVEADPEVVDKPGTKVGGVENRGAGDGH
jgi:hypothetical protein